MSIFFNNFAYILLYKEVRFFCLMLKISKTNQPIEFFSPYNGFRPFYFRFKFWDGLKTVFLSLLTVLTELKFYIKRMPLSYKIAYKNSLLNFK